MVEVVVHERTSIPEQTIDEEERAVAAVPAMIEQVHFRVHCRCPTRMRPVDWRATWWQALTGAWWCTRLAWCERDQI